MAMSAFQVPFTSTISFTSGPTASRTLRTRAVASFSVTAGYEARIFMARCPALASFAADSPSFSGLM